ncbi:MAG TPA: extracellular solute-binding protein [Clostridia bacterium]|nr:extracellular solute-binding protein [Clostridia bacterium]
MKKVFALVLALCVAVCSAALAIEDPIKNQTKYPVAKEPITLSVFNSAHAYTRVEFGVLPIWERMREMTNISLNFETYKTDVAEKLTLRLTEAVLPDVIYKVGLDNAVVVKYAQDGIIVPITGYLKEYAPNYYYQIENDPVLKASVTMSDGEIYGFAYIVSAPSSMSTPWSVRTEWLEKLGYDEVPAGLNELKDMLIKFRDSDMNGNGEKDEVGLISNRISNLLWHFYGAFNIGTPLHLLRDPAQ